MAETYIYDPTDVLHAKGQSLQFYQTFSGASVSFKAFLTQYSEAYNCQWNPQNVFGRPDPIQTYQGTSRSLRLAWKIPAFDINDAQGNLMKTSTLARMLYPEYSKVDNASTISKGPLIKLKFANLIFDASRGPGGDVRTSGLLGVIKSMSWAPSLDIKDGFFDPADKLYPKLITLSISFDVLHQHTLGWEKKEAILTDSLGRVRGKGIGPGGGRVTQGDETYTNAYTPGQQESFDAAIGNINDNRQAAAQNATPEWGADAALFPWSAGIQRANTIIGETTGDDIQRARESEILGD
jgi:hypothetical protein